MPETENKTVSTLLLRFGVKKKLISALNPDRAKTKLIHRLSQQGVPDVLSTDEAALIKGLGFEIPTTATISGTATEAETSTATAVATLDTEDDDEGDDDDSVDEDPEDNEDDLDSEPLTATKGTNDPLPPADAEKGNGKASKVKVKAKVKSPKPKKKKKESGRAVFRRLINSGKAYSRKSLVDKIVQECGCKACSVSGWISVSKKKGNAFGFVLSETGEKGKRTLEKK